MKHTHICFAGKQLSGEDAPLASQLSEWLEAHPGWVVVEEDSDEDEEDSDEEEEGTESKLLRIRLCILA